MKISVERARAILGREADNLSDDQVARMCRELEDYARLIVRQFDQVEAGKAEQLERGVV